MKKSRRGIFRVLGFVFFTAGIWMAGDLPEYNIAGEIGGFLVGQSLIVGQNPDQTGKIAWELLGGQEYFAGGDSSAVSRLALEENSQETADTEDADAVTDSSGKVQGDVYESDSVETMNQTGEVVRKSNAYVEKLKNTLDTEYLLSKFYIVDSTTSVTEDLFDVKKLLDMDMTLEKKKDKKQILIYHTHAASEKFSDSSDKIEDSVVGVGDELASELEKLGYGVVHDRSRYDWIDGALDRSLAYNKSLEGIEKIRKENPDIKVIIDLHRDSVGKGKHTYTTIQGKKTAIVMFFNGMSRSRSGPITYLANSNLQGNLAFSLQCKCKAMEYYDGFTKPIYLKGYRYNLHLEKRSLLIELGNENNTVEEAKNAAAPLAFVLDKVLSGQE